MINAAHALILYNFRVLKGLRAAITDHIREKAVGTKTAIIKWEYNYIHYYDFVYICNVPRSQSKYLLLHAVYHVLIQLEAKPWCQKSLKLKKMYASHDNWQ